MSLHSLPPPEFASEPSRAHRTPRRHNPSAGQQAESTEAYATAVLRVLRQSGHHTHPSPASADDE